MIDVVLVHGAWAGGWVWDPVTGPLRAAGLRPHVVAGVGGDDDEVVDLDAVAARVSALVQGLERPAVLVGHSGGGVVVTRVADLVPDPDARATTVPPEAAAAVFFHDAPVDDAIAAAWRLRPQQESARLIAATWTTDRFGALPRVYVEATGDRTVPITAQRSRASPGTWPVAWATDRPATPPSRRRNTPEKPRRQTRGRHRDGAVGPADPAAGRPTPRPPSHQSGSGAVSARAQDPGPDAAGDVHDLRDARRAHSAHPGRPCPRRPRP